MLVLKHNVPGGFLEPESRELVVDTKIKQIWAVELDLLAEFDQVCRENGFRYSIAYGTLLGAVRHKGFVPWDNDVDVLMFREDYDRLCQMSDKLFTGNYFLQTDENSPMAARGHAQLRNTSTTGILKSELGRGNRPLFDFNQGIFLDIFPLDSIPNGEGNFDCLCSQIDALKSQVGSARYSLAAFQKRKCIPMGRKSILRGAFNQLLGGEKRVRTLNARIQDQLTVYDHTPDCQRVSLLSLGSGIAKRSLYERQWFEDLIELPFEHLHVYGPRQFERVLSVNYGNWHRHVVGGEAHGGVLFDVDHPYTDYLDKNR